MDQLQIINQKEGDDIINQAIESNDDLQNFSKNMETSEEHSLSISIANQQDEDNLTESLSGSSPGDTNTDAITTSVDNVRGGPIAATLGFVLKSVAFIV